MSELTGKMIANHYRVEAFLGRGGMAEVYKVWDSKRSTHLALKMLHADLAFDRLFMRRFQREAETLARLQHPNIVRFYGIGQHKDNAFMLLEYVEGRTLKEHIFKAHGPVSVGVMRAVLRAVCSALQFAHSENLVHCDLKPANIMLENSGRVLLSDFGIARMTDTATATMVGMGTPAYMAPEQVQGLDPTPQTDIYALGIVLYEMLSGGERPFTGERATITGTASEKVRWEQVNLPHVPLRQHNPQIAPQLEALVLRCLEKDPRRRPQSALDVLNAFERSQVEQAAPGVQDSPVEPLPQEALARREQAKGRSQPTGQVPAARRRVAGVPSAGGVQPAAASQPARPWWRQPGYLVGLFALLVALLLMLGQPGPEPTPTVPPVVLAVATETASPTPEPSATPQPTETPTPSDPPTPTPTITLSPTATGLLQFIADDFGVPMALVPGGSFQMGGEASDAFSRCKEYYSGCQLGWFTDEEPVHTVTLSDFYIDQYEVTTGRYAECVAAGLCDAPEKMGSSTRNSYYGSLEYVDYPVIYVDWNAASTYCAWRGARLPTEAEWEMAARGGLLGALYPWGDESPNCDLANYSGCAGDTVPVGSYPANNYRLYDMAGNVWEWVADWHAEDYYTQSPEENPTGPLSGKYRVLRGGSLSVNLVFLWVANRHVIDPSVADFSIGFRCVRSP